MEGNVLQKLFPELPTFKSETNPGKDVGFALLSLHIIHMVSLVSAHCTNLAKCGLFYESQLMNKLYLRAHYANLGS